MTNPVDREVISTYLDEYIGQFLFEQQNPFKSRFTTRDALEEVITQRIEELKNLPGITSNMVMLSSAADGLYQRLTSARSSENINNYFASQSQLTGITDLLSRLSSSLEKSSEYEEFGLGRLLVRWEVVKFQIDHVKRVAGEILEEIQRLYQCLLQAHWPSAETRDIVQQITRGHTPSQWRSGSVLFIIIIIIALS